MVPRSLGQWNYLRRLAAPVTAIVFVMSRCSAGAKCFLILVFPFQARSWLQHAPQIDVRGSGVGGQTVLLNNRLSKSRRMRTFTASFLIRVSQVHCSVIVYCGHVYCTIVILTVAEPSTGTCWRHLQRSMFERKDRVCVPASVVVLWGFSCFESCANSLLAETPRFAYIGLLLNTQIS